MATNIVMPRLSDTMSEGTVGKWLKREGDQVQKGDIIAEIETDKANMEMESFYSGVLARILIPEGQTVPIGQTIAILTAPGEGVPADAVATPAAPSAAPAAPASPPTAAPVPVAAPAPAAAPAPVTPAAPAEPVQAPQEGRLRVSPLARRLAEEHNVDLQLVRGTGPSGRITQDDVQSFISQPPLAPSAAPEPLPAQISSGAAFPGLTEEDEVITPSTMQQTILRRMLDAKAAAPHFYVTSEIDMTEAVVFRTSVNAAVGEGVRITFNDIVVKAAAMAIKAFPQVNASVQDGKFLRHKAINIGVAVAIPNGLVVPSVRNADQKGLGQIARETRELAEKARNRRLTLQELEGSTFSITNLGMYDVDQFTGIINLPNAAILAVGSITKKPVVKNDEIVIADRMRVTLSVDHRILYGADAAQFLQELKRILEHPGLLAY